jgi:CRISPR-associated protein Csm1
MGLDENKFRTVVMGALLHDIGKVVQRASEDPTLKKHTEWGYEWMKEHIGDELAANAAIAHHYTKDDDYALASNIGLIWYQSDNLASAVTNGKEKLEEKEWYCNIPLASPFSRIRNPDNCQEYPTITYLPIIHDGIYEASEDKLNITKEDYKIILKNFERDLQEQNVQRPHSIDFVLMLYEKHFSTVPSISMKAYDGLSEEKVMDMHPDISLYDHSKLASAIAGCMFRYYADTYRDQWTNNKLIKDEILNASLDGYPYLLIGGDISGVQKFIYTITSKGALKSLKGRSFYLELLVEHAVFELLNELRLTRCNLIFSGGGHFYILSHNTTSAKQSIKNVKEKIDKFLLKEFKGSLQLHLEYVELKSDAFKDASPKWHDLSEKLEMSKKKKWQDKLEDILQNEMPHKGCLTESCEICFREDLPLEKLEIGDNVLNVCEPCLRQRQLGEMLTGVSKKKYPVLYRLAAKPKERFIKIDDTYYQLKRKWDSLLHEDAEIVYIINDFTAKHYAHPKSIFLPLGIYQHDELKELEDASNIFGIKRIAVMRMDVDNLGKIFSMAMKEEDRSFSRMASISRNLNIFFKYYLNDVAEGLDIREPIDLVNRDIKKKGRMLSVVYAGGDDLFLIGHWLDIAESAFDIKNHFQRYTGNPFITISGGITSNHEKYPVYQYARDSSTAEETSKNAGKKAVTFFEDFCFNWDEAAKILERIRLFAKFLQYHDDHLEVVEEILPTTFFHRLLALSSEFNKNGVLILPKAAYLVSRMKLKDDNLEDALKIKEAIMSANSNEWKIIQAATLWTLMLIRKGGE